MNTNDLVYKVAERARELANEPINMLRLAVGTSDFRTAAIKESKHLSRGELIEEILTEEFIEKFPKEIEDE